MNRTGILRPEVLPYASIEIVHVDHTVTRILAPITVPERFRDLPLTDSDRPCDVCGLRAGFHYDGWDGNYLGCDEAANRHGRVTHVQAAARTQAERAAFHLLLTHPATAARLDAMLEENRQLDIDAQLREDDRLEDERNQAEDHGGCSANCGFCGRCS